MELSVVILNYKVPYHLYLCVDSVVKATTTMGAEIIVVDNASADESHELITSHFPSVKWIQLSDNLGFSAGNNKAIAQAQGNYLLVLNPDTFVGENSILEALQKAKEIEDLGALGVQLIDGKGNFLPESKRNFPSFSAVKSKFFGNGETYYAKHLAPDQNGNVEVLVGAFMLMKTKEYLKVGGLDERYFMYGEDIDLSYQFIRHSHTNFYCGELSIVHFKGESTQKDKWYWQRFYKAMFLFYKKNFPEDKVKQQLIQLATTTLSWMKRTTQHHKNETLLPKQWLFLSSNIQLKEELERVLAEKVYTTNISELSKPSNESIGVIFDANEMNYARIISLMKKHTHKNMYFRILPRKANFIIGSDTSDTKGEVLFI